jgi:cytochrome c oxidase subunit 3
LLQLYQKKESNSNEQRKMVYGEASLPTYSVAEVQAGFKAHPEILVRTEVIYKDDAASKRSKN